MAGIRGRGLLLGIELAAPVAAAVAAACQERFLVVNAVGPATIRLAPPLVLGDDEVALALRGIEDAVAAVAAEHDGTASAATSDDADTDHDDDPEQP